MTDLNVHICCYGDRELCERAIGSVPEGIDIHVFDGRYRTFDGDTGLTPKLRQVCGRHPDVRYYAPPADQLPFGDPDAPATHRSAVAEKAQWIWEHLPPDEWTLKVDADEVVDDIDWSALEELDRTHKCVADVSMRTADEPKYPTRLWVPGNWTPWINDCLIPREHCDLDADLETRYWAFHDHRWERYRQDAIVEIDNYGLTRERSYLERRIDHLEHIGRTDRARELQQYL